MEPGERLKINDLCDALSVSLGAVLEALSRLTSEGLVVSEPRRGFCAAPVSGPDLRDLTDARVEIEALCLKQSIANGGIEWETAIVASYHQLSRTPEPKSNDPRRHNNSDAWAAAHAAFHHALVNACRNVWLLRVRDMLYVQSERYRHLSEALSDSARDVETEHRDIKDAVLARDTDRACALLANHFWLTAHLLLNGRLAPVISVSHEE